MQQHKADAGDEDRGGRHRQPQRRAEREGSAWYAHITLSMAAAAFLTIVRASENAKGGPLAANTRAA